MLVLVGEAWEHAPDGAIRQHEPGDLILRPAWTRYRLTVPAEDGPPIVLLATGGTCPVERTARPRPSADERWSEPGPTGVRPEHATGERETGRGR